MLIRPRGPRPDRPGSGYSPPFFRHHHWPPEAKKATLKNQPHSRAKSQWSSAVATRSSLEECDKVVILHNIMKLHLSLLARTLGVESCRWFCSGQCSGVPRDPQPTVVIIIIVIVVVLLVDSSAGTYSGALTHTHSGCGPAINCTLEYGMEYDTTTSF